MRWARILLASNATAKFFHFFHTYRGEEGPEERNQKAVERRKKYFHV
jgi:hypothetical protein